MSEAAASAPLRSQTPVSRAPLPPVRVGVVGAGAWARDLHIPLHREAGGETELTGVWARDPEKREALAASGVPVFGTFDELVERSEAIDFAVPPAVQAGLAVRAADAGLAVMLEKPIAIEVDDARAIAAAVERSGVASTVFLTRRYHPATRRFIAEAEAVRSGGLEGVVGMQVHGGFLPGGFVSEPSPWRDELGALFDLGPHVLDLGEQLGGRILAVRVRRNGGWVSIDATHASGVIGQYAVSGSVQTAGVTRMSVFGPGGRLEFDTSGLDMSLAASSLRAEFAAAVRTGAPVTVDAARGLELALLLDACRTALRSGRETPVTS